MNILFRIKQMLFWAGYRIDQYLPMRLCLAFRNRCMPWGKPILDVVEVHIVDHCNLNCTGCLHFTPFAKKWFADVNRMSDELAALRKKFRKIRHITLLGGEPLLHPEYDKTVAAVKKVSPESLITIVTNGIVLKGEALERFIAVCRKYDVRVKWTVYPPLMNRRNELVVAFKTAGVKLFTVDVNDFYVKMNPSGGNAKKAMRFCRKTTYCPYLRDGRIYTCAQAFHIRDYVSAYEKTLGLKCKMVSSSGLDVYAETIDGWKILQYFMTPCATCSFCADKVRFIAWKKGYASVREWEV